MEIKGINGQMELTADGVIIRRKGALGFITQGFKGDKHIPYSSITTVQFKKPGMLTNGYLQLGVLGGNEARGGVFDATQDENTVMFKAGSQATEFELLSQKIRDRVAASKKPVAPISQSMSAADELEKLAGLLEKGYLTREEFDAKKATILARA